jgi:hypothetical protein
MAMDADAIVRLIFARCPELGPEDMRMIEMLPLITDAIAALSERMDRLEGHLDETLGVGRAAA